VRRILMVVCILGFCATALAACGRDPECGPDEYLRNGKCDAKVPDAVIKRAEASKQHARPKVIDVFANEIEEAYDANEVLADSFYKDKVVRVDGAVGSVRSGIGGHAHVELQSRERLVGVDCEFDDDYKNEAAVLQRGQHVLLIGECEGKMMTIGLRHCRMSNAKLREAARQSVVDDLNEQMRGSGRARLSLLDQADAIVIAPPCDAKDTDRVGDRDVQQVGIRMVQCAREPISVAVLAPGTPADTRVVQADFAIRLSVMFGIDVNFERDGTTLDVDNIACDAFVGTEGWKLAAMYAPYGIKNIRCRGSGRSVAVPLDWKAPPDPWSDVSGSGE
jgi:hypothetical protein